MLINMKPKSKFWVSVIEILIIFLQVSVWGVPCTQDQTISPQEYDTGTGCFCDGVIRPFLDHATDTARFYICMNHKTKMNDTYSATQHYQMNPSTNASNGNEIIKSTLLTNVSVTRISTSINMCFILVVLCCLSTFI